MDTKKHLSNTFISISNSVAMKPGSLLGAQIPKKSLFLQAAVAPVKCKCLRRRVCRTSLLSGLRIDTRRRRRRPIRGRCAHCNISRANSQSNLPLCVSSPPRRCSRHVSLSTQRVNAGCQFAFHHAKAPTRVELFV
jgi:hypothetical protein